MSESIILTGASNKEKSNKQLARKLIEELIEIRIQEDVEQLTDLTATEANEVEMHGFSEHRWLRTLGIVYPKIGNK
jgi:predicted house-cleaning noncanonical NTP pyrophosphatase (MazG superfamily)